MEIKLEITIKAEGPETIKRALQGKLENSVTGAIAHAGLNGFWSVGFKCGGGTYDGGMSVTVSPETIPEGIPIVCNHCGCSDVARGNGIRWTYAPHGECPHGVWVPLDYLEIGDKVGIDGNMWVVTYPGIRPNACPEWGATHDVLREMILRDAFARGVLDPLN